MLYCCTWVRSVTRSNEQMINFPVLKRKQRKKKRSSTLEFCVLGPELGTESRSHRLQVAHRGRKELVEINAEQELA